MIKTGDILTIATEVIGISGEIIFTEGQKVEVEEVFLTGNYYGRSTGIYYPEKINCIKVKDQYGVWLSRTFKELRDDGIS